MDDIITVVKKAMIKDNLQRINKLHPNLKFTNELENEKGEVPFLDMKLIHNANGTVQTVWYRKNADTGLTMDFLALAPMKY